MLVKAIKTFSLKITIIFLGCRKCLLENPEEKFLSASLETLEIHQLQSKAPIVSSVNKGATCAQKGFSVTLVLGSLASSRLPPA